MISDQPLESRLINLEVLADMLGDAILAIPEILRLEPTVKSTMSRLRITSFNKLSSRFGPAHREPHMAARDGLLLSMADQSVNVQIDIATDIGHPAVDLAETVQERAAETIHKAGLTAGSINVTILAIEGATGRT